MHRALCPRALPPIDEIQRCGGVDDAPSTFDGGAVPMFRYQLSSKCHLPAVGEFLAQW
jgi:hypothetical protein